MKIDFVLALVNMMLNFPGEASKLEGLLREAVGNVPFLIDYKVALAELILANQSSGKISAIKSYRVRTNVGLLEAKTVIEKSMELNSVEFDAKQVIDGCAKPRW